MWGDLKWDSRVETTAKEKGLVGTAQARVTGKGGTAAKGPSVGRDGLLPGDQYDLEASGDRVTLMDRTP